MSRKDMGTIYVGGETGKAAVWLAKIDPGLRIADAHVHPCRKCQRPWYCWCGNEDRQESICSACFHEESLPKVIRVASTTFGSYKKSKMFSDIEVTNGGWTDRWVTTRELRAALDRWINQEYKANPPEVTEQAGAYQCGGCRFFLALDSDYGLCASKDSPYDGKVVFEHVGCKANPWYIKNHPQGGGA